MEEIKVRDYCRTKNGFIGKIENINDFREPSMKYAIDIQKQDVVFVGDEDIIKHSPNIIDLIEEGDYVNGERVLHIEITTTTEYLTNDCYIKSIVTHEQFNQVKYEV